MKIHAVGRIENEIVQKGRFDADELISRIILDRKFCRALDGIEGFSHIIVVFWMHGVKAKERLTLKVHPRRDCTIPLTGVFATRSPVRPNPIGITIVKLLIREKNILTIKGLDAIDGTPVLDIKPYIPEKLSMSEIKVPT